MIAQTGPQLFVPLLIAPLFVWRLYARMRRSIGRQKFSRVRPWVSVSVYGLLGLLLVFGLLRQPAAAPVAMAALAAAAVVGVGLGLLSLRLTKFEQVDGALFYTPNAHIGVALSAILVLRVGYRFLQINTGTIPAPLGSSPLTLAIFGAMAGYFVSYAIGLIRWSRRASRVATPIDSTATS